MPGIDNRNIRKYSKRASRLSRKSHRIKISAKNLFSKMQAAFSMLVFAPVAA